MSARTLRARALLLRYGTVVVAAALVLAGVGGVAAYDAYVDPGTETVERTVDEWRLDGSFQHGATVTAAAEGTPFEPNSTVANREVYFERVMPVLDGEFVLALDGTSPVNISVERRLVVASVEAERGGGETVYWQRNRSLGSTSTTLEPGERTSVGFAVNVSDARREAVNVNERLDSPGEILTTVVVDVETSGVDGTGPNRTLSFGLPIESGGAVYRVGDGSRTERINLTTTTTVPADPGPIRSAGGPFALVLGVAGAVAVVVARGRGWLELSSRERDWLTYRTQRAEYTDWISEGRVPDAALDAPAVEVDELEALADVAIDTDERVLNDTDRGSYLVLSDDVRYVYDPPEAPDADVDGTRAPDATGDELPPGDDAPPAPDATLDEGVFDGEGSEEGVFDGEGSEEGVFDGEGSEEGVFDGEGSEEGVFDGEGSEEGVFDGEGSEEGVFDGEGSEEGVFADEGMDERLFDDDA